MWKLILMVTTLDAGSAAYMPETFYSSLQECQGHKVYKVKALEEAVLYDAINNHVRAECVEVKGE